MKDLIEALTIFSKYDSGDNINCEHDELLICIDPYDVSEEDINRLEELSFTPNDVGGFSSYRFGSC
jgi:hypothetical protein